MNIKRHLQAGLAGLLVVQAVVILTSLMKAEPTATEMPLPSFVEVGDTLPTLKATFSGKDSVLRFSKAPLTLLLSVKSTCRWCTEAMPQIKRDIEKAPSSVSVVVISSEPDSVTERYLRDHGVDLAVTSLNGNRGTPERSLTARTPWAFLIDSAGVVRKSGHAADLNYLLTYASSH